jgi:hypothetical protein
MAVNSISNAFCGEIEDAINQDNFSAGGMINITSRLKAVSRGLRIN